MSDIKSIILTMFKNNHPLHNFIVLTCRIANTTKPIIITLKARIIENWAVHSQL